GAGKERRGALGVAGDQHGGDLAARLPADAVARRSGRQGGRGAVPGRLIRTVPETGSTSADLRARLAAGERPGEGDWLVADRQTGGRGRQGRPWLDAPGNFVGSTVVHLSPQDPPPASLSFAAALAVYEVVLPRIGNPRDLQLKWPNDVLLGGDKFCGLLLEREGGSVVVGIGVN